MTTTRPPRPHTHKQIELETGKKHVHQNPQCEKHCEALKCLLTVLHDYFVGCNGQREREVGHKLWAIINAEFIRPQPTEEDMKWAEEELRKHYQEVKAPPFKWVSKGTGFGIEPGMAEKVKE